MVPTADGKGYWLVASDGGIFAFGDALYYGLTGSDQRRCGHDGYGRWEGLLAGRF